MKSRPSYLFSFCKSLWLAIVIAGLPLSLSAQVPLVVVGPDAGHAPIVKVVVRTNTGINTVSFLAYRPTFTGGVRVAVGDVNGDGVSDIITAPGPGMSPRIRVFDGLTGHRLQAPIGDFFAYPPFFRGGVFVAAGDVNGDGKDDIIVGPGGGAPPLVRVFDGATGNTIQSFLAYSPLFLGGVRVAAGDVNGDGRAEIFTGPGAGVGPLVKVFNGNGFNLLTSFLAYAPNFTGGVFVAAGDVTGDNHAEIITGAGPGAGPLVKVFDAVSAQTLFSFLAFDPNFQGGVRVAAGDVNGDSFADIITGAGPGAGPRVKVFDSHSLAVLHDFFAYEPDFLGGIFVGGGFRARQR